MLDPKVIFLEVEQILYILCLSKLLEKKKKKRPKYAPFHQVIWFKQINTPSPPTQNFCVCSRKHLPHDTYYSRGYDDFLFVIIMEPGGLGSTSD